MLGKLINIIILILLIFTYKINTIDDGFKLTLDILYPPKINNKEINLKKNDSNNS
jgi:hypothetical protein